MSPTAKFMCYVNAPLAISFTVLLIIAWAREIWGKPVDRGHDSCPGCYAAFYQSVYNPGRHKCDVCGRSFVGKMKG